jgi:hypothetical protein
VVRFARGDNVWWHEGGSRQVREGVVDNDDGGSVVHIIPGYDGATVAVWRYLVHPDEFDASCSYCAARGAPPHG